MLHPVCRPRRDLDFLGTLIGPPTAGPLLISQELTLQAELPEDNGHGGTHEHSISAEHTGASVHAAILVPRAACPEPDPRCCTNDYSSEVWADLYLFVSSHSPAYW